MFKKFLSNILPSRNMHLTRRVLNAELVKQNREKYVNMTKEEKRELYNCGNKYLTLDKIQTWPEYYADKNLNPTKTGIQMTK